MDRARRAFWLAGAVLVLATGCSKEQAPPELDLPALTIHVCLSTEPNGVGPCSDEALASACPPEQPVDRCRQEALAQIAEADRYDPTTDEGIGVGGISITLAATAGVFGVLGVVLARRNRGRNREAFDAALPALRAAGFHPADPEVPLSAAAPRLRGRWERSRRVVRRDGDAAMWLYETEKRGDGVNALPPIRWAFAHVPDEVAAVDQSTLAAVLHDHVDPDGPFVGAWLGDGQLVLWTRVLPRRTSKRTPPMSLLELGELHATLVADLRAGAAASAS